MAPTPQLQWVGFLYNLKHLNASDRDIVMNFTRLDPIFRNVTNITGLLAIPPLELLFQNATNHTTAIMAKNATKMIPRGPATYLGHVGNFTSLNEKAGAAVSKSGQNRRRETKRTFCYAYACIGQHRSHNI
jgi:hypothetical protein